MNGDYFWVEVLAFHKEFKWFVICASSIIRKMTDRPNNQ